MDPKLINLQTKRVEVEIKFLSAKVANAVEQISAAEKLLIEVGLALEELHGAIGDPEEPHTTPPGKAEAGHGELGNSKVKGRDS